MDESPRAKIRRMTLRITESDPTGVSKAAYSASQEASLWWHGGTKVNDFLWYDLVNKEYPHQLGIHLFPVGEKLSERKVAFKEYKLGLDNLAERLRKDDTEFQNVTHITGWSKLVYKFPKVLESLGFTLGERDDEKGEALAIMTRAEFIKKPWNRTNTATDD